jgi:tetratricopeptide (TPR) repeat protein
MLRSWILLFAPIFAIASSPWEEAHELYQRTEYTRSLAVVLPLVEKDAAMLGLIGQDYFMLGEYRKSTEAFEKAIVLEPRNGDLYHWLGRAYGRRAETGNPFSAPGYATKARQMFETSVALDPTDKEAVSDLFDFYLQAPGFLGGGMHKAEALAAHMAQLDPAEGHFDQAQLEDKRKEYDSAEQHLRRAAELAPRQVGRVLDVAKYLAKRGRIKESEVMFDQAARLAPNSPQILFDRADIYIQQKRNLDEARQMLQRYVRSPLTPDDPPRERAEVLLRKIGS